MTKLAIWLTVGILLPYYIFTSGLAYWASGSEVTGGFIVPFSWALSADRGFTPIATEGDIDCVEWLLYESDPDILVLADSNGFFLFTGHMQAVTGASFDAARPKDRVEGICDIFTLDQCYLFHTDWNVRNGKQTDCTNVGLRRQYPFKIENKEDGCLLYSTYVQKVINSHIIYVPHPGQVQIGEVFRSGDSVVYEKLANVN